MGQLSPTITISAGVSCWSAKCLSAGWASCSNSAGAELASASSVTTEVAMASVEESSSSWLNLHFEPKEHTPL